MICTRRYVHNNIFFSFAVDGDFSLMQQMREQNQAGETSTEKPSTSNGDVKVDNAETSEVDASGNGDANAAAPVVESEQATYASANNDLKGTKAYNNADVSGLYTLAMAIIDYRGHRVVAQVGTQYYDISRLKILQKNASRSLRTFHNSGTIGIHME